MADTIYKTPQLDELEKGPWPSFVTEIKTAAKRSPMAKDLLGQLEQSYAEKIGHWKHGGIVGVMGYGGGVIGRYSDLPEEYPEHRPLPHHPRQPAGRLVLHLRRAPHALRHLGTSTVPGLTNMHGSTGDIVLLGRRDRRAGAHLRRADRDRISTWAAPAPTCGRPAAASARPAASGPATTRWRSRYDLTQDFQDELHRPAFPYKFKFKMSGCPNDCVASIARADMSIIGTWRDEIQHRPGRGQGVRRRRHGHPDGRLRQLPRQVHGVGRQEAEHRQLPTAASACTASTSCPRRCARARTAAPRSCSAAKAPIVEGALLSSVLVPFIKIEPPYDGAQGPRREDLGRLGRGRQEPRARR